MVSSVTGYNFTAGEWLKHFTQFIHAHNYITL